MTSTGALSAYSGAKTGRSPLDKRVVKEPGSLNDVWWGPVNKPMSPEVSAAHFLKVVPIRTPGSWPCGTGMCDTWNMFTCHATRTPVWSLHVAHLPELDRGDSPAASLCRNVFWHSGKRKTPQLPAKAQ
jgi:hypothetical protein